LSLTGNILSLTGNIRAYKAYTKRIDFFFFWRFFSENQRLLHVVSGDKVMSSIYWQMSEKAVILVGAWHAHFSIMLSLPGIMRACKAYTKRIDFLFFCGFFLESKGFCR